MIGPLLKEVKLECDAKAYPAPSVRWSKLLVHSKLPDCFTFEILRSIYFNNAFSSRENRSKGVQNKCDSLWINQRDSRSLQVLCNESGRLDWEDDQH